MTGKDIQDRRSRKIIRLLGNKDLEEIRWNTRMDTTNFNTINTEGPQVRWRRN
jgi:hypothetical protein